MGAKPLDVGSRGCMGTNLPRPAGPLLVPGPALCRASEPAGQRATICPSGPERLLGKTLSCLGRVSKGRHCSFSRAGVALLRQNLRRTPPAWRRPRLPLPTMRPCCSTRNPWCNYSRRTRTRTRAHARMPILVERPERWYLLRCYAAGFLPIPEAAGAHALNRKYARAHTHTYRKCVC